MVASLLRSGDRATIVPIPDHRSWTAAALAEACPAWGGALRAAGSLTEGLAWLMDAGEGAPGASRPGPLPVVAGSLHLLGALLPHLDPPHPGVGPPTRPS